LRGAPAVAEDACVVSRAKSPAERRTRAASRARAEGVPAVLHTVAILRYLQEVGNRPSAMMEIARALEINASTCFNILRTLAGQRILNYDEDTRRYTLGMALIEFASLVDSHGHLLTAAQTHAELVAREVNQVCLIFRKTEDDAFLVVGKAEGRQPLKVTATLGDRIPPNGAVVAKAWYSWSSDEEIDRMVALHGLPARAPHSITGMLDFKRELARTRARGFSISVGEYYEEHNAVGCAVLSPHSEPLLLLVITGFASLIPVQSMAAIGRRLRAAADAVSADVFGTTTEATP
jgi:IclR family acetate operon transcriptional repressor